MAQLADNEAHMSSEHTAPVVTRHWSLASALGSLNHGPFPVRSAPPATVLSVRITAVYTENGDCGRLTGPDRATRAGGGSGTGTLATVSADHAMVCVADRRIGRLHQHWLKGGTTITARRSPLTTHRPQPTGLQPTAHCPSPATHRQLPTASRPPLTAHRPSPIAHRSPPTTRRSAEPWSGRRLCVSLFVFLLKTPPQNHTALAVSSRSGRPIHSMYVAGGHQCRSPTRLLSRRRTPCAYIIPTT